VSPTITFSLQLLYSGIQEAIRSKSQATSDAQASLLANAATSNLEVSFRRCFPLRLFSTAFSGQKLRLEQSVAELKSIL